MLSNRDRCPSRDFLRQRALGRVCLTAGLAIAAALPVAGALAAPAGDGVPQPRAVTPRGPLASDETQMIDVFGRATQSVVYITTIDRVVEPWSTNVREVPAGTGSGFLWDDQGHVVTNYHVVAEAKGAVVRLSDQRSFAAELVGTSPENDLAVLRIKIPKDRPAPLPLGDSRSLRVGQRVLAIGNPFGLDHTLTTGVISALDRSIDGKEGAVRHLIQTDAAINPGNSGGALINSRGELVGINTGIFSQSGGYQGIGFAVPSNLARRIVQDLIKYGQVRRGSIGFMEIAPLTSRLAEELGAPSTEGVVIMRMERGNAPAYQAGIEPGDIILSVNGTKVTDASQLVKLIADAPIGGTVAVDVLREGRRRSFKVAVRSLEERPARRRG